MICVSEQNPDRLGFRGIPSGGRALGYYQLRTTVGVSNVYVVNFQLFHEATEIYAENESPGPTVPATKSTPHTTTILRYLKVLDRYTQTQEVSRLRRRLLPVPTPSENSSECDPHLDCPWPASSTSCRSGKRLARQSYLLLPRIMQASSALHSVSAWEAATARHHDGGRNSRRSSNSSNSSRGSSQHTRERCRAMRCWQPCENAAPETLRRRCSNSSIEAPR